jgi:hypothetical protein
MQMMMLCKGGKSLRAIKISDLMPSGWSFAAACPTGRR